MPRQDRNYRLLRRRPSRRRAARRGAGAMQEQKDFRVLDMINTTSPGCRT
jgi:hypothetical protein